MKNLRINTKNILIGIIIILIIITFLYFIRNNNIDNFLACPPGQVSKNVRSGGIGNITFRTQCVKCGYKEISISDTECKKCGSTQRIESNQCIDCPPGQIGIDNKCGCPFGQTLQNNTCVCPPGKIVQGMRCTTCPP